MFFHIKANERQDTQKVKKNAFVMGQYKTATFQNSFLLLANKLPSTSQQTNMQ